jgi:hypothetical protein
MRAPTVTLLPLVLWLISATAVAAAVYKWVDEKGVTHYSDQPHADAKTVDIRAAPAIGTSPLAVTASAASAAPPTAAERTYSLCEIYRPENDEVFLNTSTITAKLRLEPVLVPGDQVGVALDGKRLADQPRAATEFVISDVPRGTHSLFVMVTTAQGKPLCTTAPITFHVRQPSVQAPVKAVRPRF